MRKKKFENIETKATAGSKESFDWFIAPDCTYSGAVAAQNASIYNLKEKKNLRKLNWILGCFHVTYFIDFNAILSERSLDFYGIDDEKGWNGVDWFLCLFLLQISNVIQP